jgi:hypothetical protein
MGAMMQSMSSELRLHPLNRVADLDGYDWTNERWLRHMARTGRLGTYKVGGKLLVSLNELDELVVAGRREPVT